MRLLSISFQPVFLEGWRSGQSQQTVNLPSLALRWFKSSSLHHIIIKFMINKTHIAFILLGCALCMTGCGNVPITGRSQVITINETQLMALSDTEYKKLISAAKVSSNPTANAQLDRVAKRLVAGAEALAKKHGFSVAIEKYKWEFVLLDDDAMVNAFCMPGGKVAVYTGILPVTQDDEGLAVVLSHEIAHAIAKHGNERMSQETLVKLGGSLLDLSTQTSSEETRALFGGLYGVGTTFGVLLPYSRAHESEADRIGLMILIEAGYNPKAAVAFWERMAARSAGRTAPEFLSTHPSDETRINDIKSQLPK